MIGYKWKIFQQARENVRVVRTEFNAQEKNFRCLDNKNLVCAGDPCDNNGEPPKRCRQYALNVHCQDTTCPYHEWNTEHYYTYLKLCSAKWNRFGAFFNLFTFGTKQKEKE